MGFMNGKKILITGLASNLSIAYGIAQAMHREGAELAFTYQNDKLKPRVEKMGAEFGSTIFLPCDVASDAEIDAVFKSLGEQWGGLDGLIHAIAFAPREAIEGRFLDGCTRENFALAHDISAYSFAALMRGAAPLMKGRNAAALALTYLGAVKAIPNYNTMGLAKASLEAAIRYLAADLGFTVAETFGPEAVTANQIANAKTGGCDIIIDNVHNPVGSPLAEVAPNAAYIVWRNFPDKVERNALLHVIRENIASLMKAM